MAKGSGERGSRSIRALEILEAMAANEQAMTTSDIVEATGLPKATVHRLCALLEKESFLAVDVGGRGLRPGQRMRELALGVVATGGDFAYRHRVLANLSKQIGETCNLNAPMGSEMIYLDRVETDWPLRPQLPVGSRVPLHCTASGKLYLSSLPIAKRHRLVQALVLDRRAPNTITDPDILLRELERISADMVGTDDEEFIEGMTAIAVPVTDARGRLAGTVACHAPSVRMSMEDARTHIPILRRAAKALSA